jgi:hypothetical protein
VFVCPDREMRDPKRIEPLLALIREAWHMHPDIRLIQLLHWAVSIVDKPDSRMGFEPLDPFYAEDYYVSTGLRAIKLGRGNGTPTTR